jgi:sugar phosphate isomerase/epimerase
MSTPPPFGVQSWCFRHFKDNHVVAQKVRDLGLNQIEISGAHADFSQPEAMKEIVAIYRQAGISVVSIGVQTFEGLDAERAWFECAAAAGARHISAHFRINNFLQAIPRVRSWSREFGIRVGLHCHGGYMFGGQPDVIEYLLDLGGPEIGLCIDTAWALQIGPWRGNPVEWARKFAGKIYGVHYKDFLFAPNGHWSDTIVGKGNLDLPAFNAALKEGGFDGVAVIEYEADIENPDPALKRCVESMLAQPA